MWVLKNVKNEDSIFYIKNGSEHVVGRNIGDLCFSTDKSVSRKHATLYRNNNVIFVEDHNSKYGTYVDEGIEEQKKIVTGRHVELKENSRIMFGLLGNEWLLSRQNMKTCVSTIKDPELALIKTQLDELGITLSKEWSNDCTHLTMPSITLTLKVVLALVQNKSIVRPEFWTECVKCYNGNLPLPSPDAFLPNVKESSISQQAKFHADERRTSLFTGKLFIFMSRQQMKNYEMVISSSGGRSQYLGGGKITHGELSAPHSIVVQHVPGYKSSQSTQDLQGKIDSIFKYLTTKKKRIIPEVEIGLAILYVSTEMYCNPSFNFASVILQEKNETIADKKKVLAPETQETITSTISIPSENIKFIDETLNSSIGRRNESIATSVPCDTPASTKTNSSPINVHSKKINNEDGSHLRHSDDNLFCFVQDDPQPSTSVKKTEKLQLTFHATKRKHRESFCNDDNLFNFIPDAETKTKTRKVDVTLSNNKETSKDNVVLFEKSNKRKHDDLDVPDAKRLNIASSRKSMLCANTIKYVCQKRFPAVKEEPEAAALEITMKLKELDILPAVVILCDNLMVKRRQDVSKDTVDNTLTDFRKINFKKFSKVKPKSCSNLVVSSNMLVEYHQKSEGSVPKHFLEESSGDEDIDNFRSFTFTKQATRGRSRRL